MVSYNPSNNAYNPNARTMQTSTMPSSGGGGSIIINKSGYDMTPYSNLPTNNTNNLRIEDINQRFTDGFNNYHTNTLMPALNNYDRSIIQPQLQNVNNKFDEFEAGFKNYHDNFIQPSFYEAGRNHDALNTKINTNRSNHEIEISNAFDNYHKDVIIPTYNNFRNDFDSHLNDYDQNLTSIYRNQMLLNNDIKLSQKQHTRKELDNNKLEYVIDSSPPIFDHFKDQNKYVYHNSDYDSSSEIIDPYDINTDPYDMNSISTYNSKDEFIDSDVAPFQQFINSNDNSLTKPFDPADGYKFKPDLPSVQSQEENVKV